MSERHSRVSDCKDAGTEGRTAGEESGSSNGRQRERERERESKSRRTREAGWRATVPVGGERVAKGGGVGTPRVRPDFNDSSATES